MGETNTLEQIPVTEQEQPEIFHSAPCQVVVIWIDWYAYHVARFKGLLRHPDFGHAVVGLELVGGVGVHVGLKFREEISSSLPVQTLLPDGNWREAGKWQLARLVWARLNQLTIIH